MKILVYPSNELRKTAELVTKEMADSEEFKTNLAEMIELAKQDGIGLAATQVGWNVSLFIALVNNKMERLETPQIFVNPHITARSKTQASAVEGCLSFPGLEASIKRPDWIHIEWCDLAGTKFATEATYSPDNGGYYNRVLQHETDHLNGKVFIDYISPAKRYLVDRWIESNRSK